MPEREYTAGSGAGDTGYDRAMPFDLLIRGGTLVDGSGAAGRPADIGITGDRITSVSNLSHVADEEVRAVIDATGHVVAPGFVDPHGHSDASVLVDGALASHLRQGYTTQLSGNCGETLAPLTAASRALLEPLLRDHELEPAWTTFAGYLAAVEAQALGPNVAFLVGHGTIRGAIMGPMPRGPNHGEMTAMIAHAEAALEAGAFGISTGLIYRPGIHARPDEIAQLVGAAVRRGGLYATHIRNEADGVTAAIDEALTTARAAQAYGRRPARLQVSHLKAALPCGPWHWTCSHRPPGTGPRRGAGRGGGPVPVHGRAHDARDDPAAGHPRPGAGRRRRGAP